jgi:hypothetical protein
MVLFFLTLFSLLMIPSVASAHGEEILMTIGVQLATVVAIVFVLFIVRKFRPCLVGGVLACVFGVVLSWVVTGHMPYFENQLFITVIDVIFPMALTGAFLAWRCRCVPVNDVAEF